MFTATVLDFMDDEGRVLSGEMVNACEAIDGGFVIDQLRPNEVDVMVYVNGELRFHRISIMRIIAGGTEVVEV